MELTFGNWRRAIAPLALALLAGCTNPYLTTGRLERGLVVVLPGIEGASPLNAAVCDGLAAGGVPYAIELYDWTSYWNPLDNLNAESRNRAQAVVLARRLAAYQRTYPGRPVFLVGQSGGGAEALWAAEALPEGVQVDGIILLAAAVSPEYRLDRALVNSRRGVVNFYSPNDWVFLSVGTRMFQTMDGRKGDSAGRDGFRSPRPGAPGAALYEHLYEIGWNSRMASAGNFGLHVTSGASEFVRYYVAPLIVSRWWDSELTGRLRNGEWVDPTRFREQAPVSRPAPASQPASAATPAPTPPADDASGPED